VLKIFLGLLSDFWYILGFYVRFRTACEAIYPLRNISGALSFQAAGGSLYDALIGAYKQILATG
jgi:hypothetical protein